MAFVLCVKYSFYKKTQWYINYLLFYNKYLKSDWLKMIDTYYLLFSEGQESWSAHLGPWAQGLP